MFIYVGKISTTLEPQPAASAKPQSSPVEPVSTVDTKPSTVDKDGMLLQFTRWVLKIKGLKIFR